MMGYLHISHEELTNIITQSKSGVPLAEFPALFTSEEEEYIKKVVDTLDKPEVLMIIDKTCIKIFQVKNVKISG